MLMEKRRFQDDTDNGLDGRSHDAFMSGEKAAEMHAAGALLLEIQAPVIAKRGAAEPFLFLQQAKDRVRFSGGGNF